MQYHFGDRVTKLNISGCASLLCFSNHFPKYMRLVKVDKSKESVMLGKIRDKIVYECQALP